MTEELETLERLMRDRRSERQFLPEPIDEDVVRRLLSLASTAPSASNRQPYRFMVVVERKLQELMSQAVSRACSNIDGGKGDRHLREGVAEYAKHFVWSNDAPVVIVVLFRAESFLGQVLEGRSERDPVSEIRESLASASAAVMQLLLAAHAMGLGACWMTGPCVAESELLSLLRIPRGWRISALVPIGKVASKSAAPRRRTLSQLQIAAPSVCDLTEALGCDLS